jgi:hypothetical protein
MSRNLLQLVLILEASTEVAVADVFVGIEVVEADNIPQQPQQDTERSLPSRPPRRSRRAA